MIRYLSMPTPETTTPLRTRFVSPVPGTNNKTPVSRLGLLPSGFDPRKTIADFVDSNDASRAFNNAEIFRGHFLRRLYGDYGHLSRYFRFLAGVADNNGMTCSHKRELFKSAILLELDLLPQWYSWQKQREEIELTKTSHARDVFSVALKVVGQGKYTTCHTPEYAALAELIWDKLTSLPVPLLMQIFAQDVAKGKEIRWAGIELIAASQVIANDTPQARETFRRTLINNKFNRFPALVTQHNGLFERMTFCFPRVIDWGKALGTYLEALERTNHPELGTFAQGAIIGLKIPYTMQFGTKILSHAPTFFNRVSQLVPEQFTEATMQKS